MSKIILTGAAGFIASHVLPKLIEDHDILGIDSMEPQVHGTSSRDIRCGEVTSLGSPEVVIHLAALVGVGQSMYEPSRYVECNTMDTAKFLENLTKNKPKRLVVASSMSVYGEGEMADDLGRLRATTRKLEYYAESRWRPVRTHEEVSPQIESIYALTKYDQEQLCLMWGKANDVEVVALRFFNVYGPGSHLNNCYTNVIGIFANRILNGQAPVVYEDGQQTRDFIWVEDVADAVIHAAMGKTGPGIFNVGTGVPRTILSVANDLLEVMTADLPPVITGKRRVGDIRHCYADIDRIKATGWAPKKDWKDGLREYAEWLAKQPKPDDTFGTVQAELEEKGLLR